MLEDQLQNTMVDHQLKNLYPNILKDQIQQEEEPEFEESDIEE